MVSTPGSRCVAGFTALRHKRSVGVSKAPACSSLLVRPFVRLLRNERIDAPGIAARLAALEASGRRMPVSALMNLVTELVETTHDPYLGLRTALYTELGDFEVLEWVAMSAETWRAANEAACRYARVLSDSCDYRFEVCGDKVHLMLGSTVPLHPVTADYQLAAYHLAIQLRVQRPPSEFEVWIKHAAPADLAPYRAVFPTAELVFGAAFDGFVTPAKGLVEPLPTASPTLHRVLRAHADHLLAALAPGDSLVERVSADILETMREGNASAKRTASRLGIARRTLTRQLGERGTSYSRLLKEARYRTAIHYLCHTTYSVEDIAFLLGFSECPPFVRAFKRWSGHPPFEYRKLRAESASLSGGHPTAK
jgi:AraC-like DNA-binding protein